MATSSNPSFFCPPPHLADPSQITPPRPRKPKNRGIRPREYLTEIEIDQLAKAAATRGRYGQRDAIMILIAYHHGLRVSELVALRWDQIDLLLCHLQVRRLRAGIDSVHPLSGREIRALRRPNATVSPRPILSF
jgi:type 1 fimbriae regulatory protein FimB/type 1 fimbriae regulatory protein FimE